MHTFRTFGSPTKTMATGRRERKQGGGLGQGASISMAIMLQFLVTLMLVAAYHRVSLPLDWISFARIPRNAQVGTEGDGHRHLLDFQTGSSTLKSSSNGVRGVLIHKPSDCSTLPDGSRNVSVGSNLSKEAERVQHLKCALQRSASRVDFLLNRKLRDFESIASGLPMKDITALEAAAGGSSEADQGQFPRELLRSEEWEDSYESAVWSQPGEYLMSLEFGSPPRMLNGIVDTGSDLTWLQCQPCARCYEQSDPIYVPGFSSTYRELDCDEEECESVPTSFCDIFTGSCDYMYSYGDNSYTFGSLSTDTLTLKSTTGQEKEFPEIVFGCSHNSRGTFSGLRADGVVALGRGELSIASQLGMRLSDRFGYCLVSRQDPTSVTSPIYFGDAAILTGPGATYTPLLTNERHSVFYYLSMTGISVGGNRLDISPDVFAIADDGSGGTIIDSGTTVTNLEPSAYETLVDSFRDAVEYPTIPSDTHFDLCFDVGDDSNPKFPSLVFHLKGMDLELPEENYMIESEDQTLCLAIDRSSQGFTVIGNIQQQNYRVLYDRVNTRLGFQHTSCAQE